MTNKLTIQTHSSWQINCYDLEKSVASITKYEELEQKYSKRNDHNVKHRSNNQRKSLKKHLRKLKRKHFCVSKHNIKGVFNQLRNQ